MEAAQVVEWQVVRPAAPLRGHVRRYVGYRLEGFAAGSHLGLPSRHLTVVISLGDPTRITEMPEPGQAPGAFQLLASGLTTRRAVLAHDGRQHGVQLEMTPAGARALLDRAWSVLVASGGEVRVGDLAHEVGWSRRHWHRGHPSKTAVAGAGTLECMTDTGSTTRIHDRTTVWPTLGYGDARAAVRFLVDAFGFEVTALHPPEGDRPVQHAELRWPTAAA